MHTNPRAGAPQQVPATGTLVKASAAALVVASILLVTVVFPAEYGIDPLGTGDALGLSALSGGTTAEEPVPAPGGTKMAPVQEGPVALYPAGFKVDSREIVLGPYEYVEYKYHLERGATMLFSWRASGDVMHDFHGDPEGQSSSTAAQSFDARPRRQADGSFAAPFTGIHGWFWENLGGETITVRVTTAGFYTSAHQFRFDRTRIARDVRALDTITPATGEEAP
ncbi:MAG TPA: hypothetical protein VI485_33265 [Vicinamibacterales bacterium]|nr:hypothetical protein [Vicinamibacterales bacterium]